MTDASDLPARTRSYLQWVIENDGDKMTLGRAHQEIHIRLDDIQRLIMTHGEEITLKELLE